MGGQKLAYSPFVLAVVFRAGLFSFFSAKLGPVWPKPAPDLVRTDRFPTWGVNSPHRPSRGGETRCFSERKRRVLRTRGFLPEQAMACSATRGLLGANLGLEWFCGTVGCGWFSPVPEGTQGTQKSARGEGAKFASLARAFPRVQGGNAHQCTLQITHNM